MLLLFLGEDPRCLLLSLLSEVQVDGGSMNYLFYSICSLDTVLTCAVHGLPRPLSAKWDLQGEIMP